MFSPSCSNAEKISTMAARQIHLPRPIEGHFSKLPGASSRVDWLPTVVAVARLLPRISPDPPLRSSSAHPFSRRTHSRHSTLVASLRPRRFLTCHALVLAIFAVFVIIAI
ncbi:hypothetical protein GY45DRAFT_279730 [Cubamyces sp. BRFM 1775]|nr:hypothetical protein GY45DRAFT_279730 [Cubamyces sp. BRFM 1775]